VPPRQRRRRSGGASEMGAYLAGTRDDSWSHASQSSEMLLLLLLLLLRLLLLLLWHASQSRCGAGGQAGGADGGSTFDGAPWLGPGVFESRRRPKGGAAWAQKSYETGGIGEVGETGAWTMCLASGVSAVTEAWGLERALVEDVGDGASRQRSDLAGPSCLLLTYRTSCLALERGGGLDLRQEANETALDRRQVRLSAE